MRFIWTGDGYTNLEKITKTERTEKGEDRLFAGEEMVDTGYDEFTTTIASVIPVQGDWECLTPISMEEMEQKYLVAPVLAWGVTVTGTLVPLTATEMHGVEGPYALRKTGIAAVYSHQNLEPYVSADAWLDIEHRPKSNREP